jgi:membrane protein
VIERTPRRVRRPVALLVRTGDAAIRDRLPGLAAEIAFWVLLSLPALVLTAIAAASVVLEGADWQQQLIDRVAEVSRIALTETTVGRIESVLQDLIREAGFAIVSTAALATVWTASRAVRVVLTTLTIVYGRHDERAGWQDRLLGFAITLGALLIGIVLAPLLVAGPAFGQTLQDRVALDLSPLPEIWRALYWPTTVVMATLVIALLYHLGVPGRATWRRALPGAVLATGVWLAGSAGLRLYGMWIAAGDSAYGSLAGPVVAMLWLWLTGFAVLLGGELNAQIEHVWPPDHHQPDVEVLVTDVGEEPPHDAAGRAAAESASPHEPTRELSSVEPPERPSKAPSEDGTTRPINAPRAPRS